MDREKVLNYLKAKPDTKQMLSDIENDLSLPDSIVITAEKETTALKYSCTKAVRMISEEKPEIIYPYFSNISKWIYAKNS